jgi:hypothetical protein
LLELTSYYLYFGFIAAGMGSLRHGEEPPALLDVDIHVPPLKVNIKFDDVSGEAHHTSLDLHLRFGSGSHPKSGDSMSFAGALAAQTGSGTTSSSRHSLEHKKVPA